MNGSRTDAPLIERVHPPAAAMRLINPVMRTVLSSRFHRPISGQLLVLHFTGRRTGTRTKFRSGIATTTARSRSSPTAGGASTSVVGAPSR